MDRQIEKAKNDCLECWEIFSKTGDIQDARMLIECFLKYDTLLLDQQNSMEL